MLNLTLLNISVSCIIGKYSMDLSMVSAKYQSYLIEFNIIIYMHLKYLKKHFFCANKFKKKPLLYYFYARSLFSVFKRNDRRNTIQYSAKNL